MNMTRKEFISKLTNLLKETYPDMTEEIISLEFNRQILGLEQSHTIIGIFVSDNLKKIKIID
jgi:hypothetical protein